MNHLHKLWHRITFEKPLKLVQAYFSGYLFTVGHTQTEYILFNKLTIDLLIILTDKNVAVAH